MAKQVFRDFDEEEIVEERPKQKRADSTEKVEKTEKKQMGLKGAMGKVCRGEVFLFLFFLCTVYPLYNEEGYIQIATNKYHFLKQLGIIFGIAIAPFALLSTKKKISDWKKRISLVDILVICYLCSILLAYAFSAYKIEALWGASGWYMGLGIQLICIGIYFAVSRYYNGSKWIWYILLYTNIIIFGWGILNRFSIYPVDMHYESPSFLSSMGNINWLSGYWSIFFSLGMILYIFSEKRSVRIIAIVYHMIALGLGVIEGSDTAFVSMYVVFLFACMIAFKKRIWMERYLESICVFMVVCQMLRLFYFLFPERVNYTSGMVKFFLGNFTAIILVLSFVLRILCSRIPSVKWRKSYITPIKWGLLFFTLCLILLYGWMLWMNTTHPGTLGKLSESTYFTWGGAWGSGRGTTFTDGVLIWKSLPLKNKIFGVGPDCFSAYAYSHPVLSEIMKPQFGGTLLTNAHNESLTILVNMGILGLLSFWGMIGSSIWSSVKKGERNPILFFMAAAILSYFFHNMFSFEQILNYPYLFVILGLSSNAKVLDKRGMST